MGEDGLDEVTLAVLAVLLFGAAVVFFGVQNPVVVAPVACFSFSSFPWGGSIFLVSRRSSVTHSSSRLL